MRLSYLVVSAALLSVSLAHADTFTTTYLAPGVQTPAGITTNYETFNSPTYVGGSLVTSFGGSSITGTYSGSYSLLGATQFGGAGGAGNYLAAPRSSSYSLSLSTGANYFGLWFSALDQANQLQFYNNGTLLDSFTPAAYIALVGACPTAAPEPNFCGNPNADFYNRDSGQQFAYLNFYDLNGTFNKVVFSETTSIGEFESDNQSAVLLPKGTAPTGTIIGGAPEPSSFALLSTGILGIVGVMRKRFV